jgi:aquaporin Z
MVSACFFATLLGYPQSPVALWIVSPLWQRVVIGLAMGSTAMAIIYSPWGKRSGAHLNPAVTFTFWRLGKVAGQDAINYGIAQFTGGVTGVLLAGAVLRPWVSHPAVNYAVTVPGSGGWPVAFVAELLISFVLMSVVLLATNSKTFAPYTGLLAGTLVAVYIILEAPISGMSMNPARTFGSAFAAHVWTGWWLYFTAPPLGMILAAEAYVHLRGARAVLCAKLHHHNSQRCIFRCGYAARAAAARGM